MLIENSANEVSQSTHEREGKALADSFPAAFGSLGPANEIEDAARAERGWLVVSVSGTDGDPIAETNKEVRRATACAARASTWPYRAIKYYSWLVK